MGTPEGIDALDYETVECNIERDRDIVTGIWKGIFGQTDYVEHMYDAFYRDCTLDRPTLYLLRHRPSNTMVGTLGVGPRRMLWQGREIRAGVFAHLAVLPEHRKVKPAIILLRSVIKASHEHFDLLYGLPSIKGAAMVRRAGFRPAADLVRYVKILRHRHYAQRILPSPLAIPAGLFLDAATRLRERLQGLRVKSRLQAEWVDAVDPRMERLWQNSPRGNDLTTIRDTPMLHWRFDLLPAVRRRYLLLSEPGGETTTWLACATHIREPNMLSVNDFWSEKGVHGIDHRAIRILIQAARAEGYHAIQLRFAGADNVLSEWMVQGFRERSRQPFYVLWPNQELAGKIGGRLHITDLVDDG
jgi:hypothetical protein